MGRSRSSAARSSSITRGTPPLLHSTSDEIVQLPSGANIAFDGASAFTCNNGSAWAIDSSNALAGPLTLTSSATLCSVAALGDIGFVTMGSYPHTVQALVDGSMHVLWRFDSGAPDAQATSYGCGMARSMPSLTESPVTHFDMLPLDGGPRHSVSFSASPTTVGYYVHAGPWPFDPRALAIVTRELPTSGYSGSCPLHLHVERDDGAVLVEKVFARDCRASFSQGSARLPNLIATDLGPVLDMDTGLFALLDSTGNVVGEPVQLPFLQPGTIAPTGETLTTVAVGSFLVVFTEPYTQTPLTSVKQTVLGCLP